MNNNTNISYDSNEKRIINDIIKRISMNITVPFLDKDSNYIYPGDKVKFYYNLLNSEDYVIGEVKWDETITRYIIYFDEVKENFENSYKLINYRRNVPLPFIKRVPNQENKQIVEYCSRLFKDKKYEQVKNELIKLEYNNNDNFKLEPEEIRFLNEKIKEQNKSELIKLEKDSICFIKVEDQIPNIYDYISDELLNWMYKIEKEINKGPKRSWYSDNFTTIKCSVYWSYNVLKDQPDILNIEISKLSE